MNAWTTHLRTLKVNGSRKIWKEDQNWKYHQTNTEFPLWFFSVSLAWTQGSLKLRSGYLGVHRECSREVL